MQTFIGWSSVTRSLKLLLLQLKHNLPHLQPQGFVQRFVYHSWCVPFLVTTTP